MATLLVDLGDILTKVMVTGAPTARLGFPSVVARRLLSADAPAGDLLLDDGGELPRLEGFDPGDYPRTRSYPGADRVLRDADAGAGARFTGWHAAAYGADRQLLGRHPTDDNVEALVHRALLEGAADADRAELVFVVDAGPKAAAIARYAESSPRSVGFAVGRLDAGEGKRVQVELTCRVVDAAACAAAELRAVDAAGDGKGVVIVDIGYLRTKLAIVSADGCEAQEQVDDVGVAGCVRRILRDSQERGLVEDEIAVIRALERSHSTIEVAGRSFDIREPFASAREEIVRELARAVERMVAGRFARRGATCDSVAIIGGGAAVAGERLAAAITGARIGIESTRVVGRRPFLLVAGARRLAATDR